jgi:hypothetical protein
VLRYSGTEPLARIMIEGPDEAAVRALAGELAAAIEAEIGAREEPAAVVPSVEAQRSGLRAP